MTTGASLRTSAAAKINLALAVGPRRPDGLHEVATVLQRVDLCDRLELEEAPALEVVGFDQDTLVRIALGLLAEEAGVEPRWRVRLEKAIPVAAGLGGGSADAAAALELAARTLREPPPPQRMLALAARVGSDVPFFLEPGPKLAEGAGERLTPLELPQDFWILLALDSRASKRSTAEVYARYDELGGGLGFEQRRAAIHSALDSCRRPRHIAELPPNDLAEAAGASPVSAALLEAGAFRADV
ncbi:MAG: 4-(cytidine 5'-diphospho)-2-C-methyl-D-erythritol kinase, partial [Actinomycetota bacterium]